MNLSLLDPYIRNALPDHREEQGLESEGLARCAAFNRRGTLLALGCNDGRCVLWDFDTRGVAMVVIGHVHPITAVSWSRNGRKLLTASTDWNIILWDVLTAKEDISIKFESPVLYAELHTRGRNVCLACPWMDQPSLVDLTTGVKTRLPRDPKYGPDDLDTNKMKHLGCSVATWTKAGDKIYMGDARGVITIINSDTLQIEKSFKAAQNSGIKSITWDKDEKQYLVNCTDKIIRLFDASDDSCLFELTDIVNKPQWKKCCFSGDGDHIIGGSAQKHEHKIYIWSRQFGQLIKILEGPKEGILDLVWHPLRPIVVSCSTSGVAYIWNAHYQQNYSSFAPGFTELEENEEYIERENEFDVVDEEEERKKKQKLAEEEEELEVDVVGHPHMEYFSEDEDDLLFLPTVPIPDSQMGYFGIGSTPQKLGPSGSKPELQDLTKKKKKRKEKAPAIPLTLGSAPPQIPPQPQAPVV